MTNAPHFMPYPSNALSTRRLPLDLSVRQVRTVKSSREFEEIASNASTSNLKRENRPVFGRCATECRTERDRGYSPIGGP